MFDEERTAFLEGGCALILATVLPDGEPHAGRGWGLTVLPDAGHVRLLLDAEDLAMVDQAAGTGRHRHHRRERAHAAGRAAQGSCPRGRGGVRRRRRSSGAVPRRVLRRHRRHRRHRPHGGRADDAARLRGLHRRRRAALRPDAGARRRRSPARRHGMSPVTLESLHLCFEGAVPAVIATASADGTPNITYLSRVHLVDHERVALSNQFFSKTARNLAENPRASVLMIDPVTYEEFRLRLVYERTERRGPVFERLRADIDALAALQRMEDVFKLQAADIYRVLDIEPVPTAAHRPGDPRRSDGRHEPGRAGAGARRAGGTALARRRPRRHARDHRRGARHAVRLRALAGPAARRGRAAPVHDREPRLRRRGGRIGGDRRRGPHRSGGGPLRAAAGRATSARWTSTPASCAGPTRTAGTSRPGTTFRCRGCPTPRASWRCRRWPSGSWSASSPSRAGRWRPTPPRTKPP